MSSTFSKLLVPIDGSEPALAATGIAIELARRASAQIVFANAIDTVVIIDLEELAKDQSEALLAAARAAATARGVASSAEILVGRLAPTLTAFARECDADLIVMGTHARTAIERILGSETAGVLRSATVPVLVVPPGAAGGNAAFTHLLVGVDDSDASDAAVELAVRYAHDTQAEITFCTVVDAEAIVRNAAVYGFEPAPIVSDARARAERALSAAVAKVRHAHVRVRHILIESPNAVEGLLAAAADAGSDAIVLGTHGRRGLRHLFLGSVAEGVAQHGTIPVFVAHAPVQSD